MTCPSCGAPAAEGARFCAQCGSPMAVRAPEDDRRKTVTVLFTDLVDSTSMAEALDPEALAAVLGRYFAVARGTVERHGGTVEKFIGDAVVGMFGIRQVREDDALRAVRTALELRDAVDRLNGELDPAFGVRLRLRSGINTGEVLVDAGQADSLAVGHAISMAARLEQVAGPGQVVVGEPTWRLVAGGATAEELAPLAVKGSSIPVRAWRVDGLAAPPAGGRPASGSYLGRAAELATVASAYAGVVAGARSVAMLVVAPPGLGKSRFATEVASSLRPAPRVAVGRGIADGGASYGPFVEVLGALAAGEGDGAFEAALAGLPDGSQVLRAARSLVAGTGVATSSEVAWVMRRVVTAVAADVPLLLVLDDLHWADPLLLDVVADLVAPSVPARVLLLAMTRPELLEDRSDWLARLPGVPVIRLAPLSTEDTERLVGERLGGDADETHRRRVIAAAAGVPLFVEQLAALDAESAGEVVPSGIRALMAARVDRIAGDARTLVEIAAIAGESFTSSDVAGVPGTEAALGSLVRREILRTGAAPETWRFGHALLRDAVIEAVPRRRRAELHERRALRLETAPEVDLERVGFHLESAWRERTAIGLPDDHARAVARRGAEALATVGRRSLARKEWHRAVALLGRAERLVQGDPARSEVLPDLVDALVQARELDAADRMHNEALRVARDQLDRARADTAWARIHFVRRTDDWPDVILRVVDASTPVFEAAGDEAWLARASVLRFFPSTSMDADLVTLKVARTYAERAGDERALIEVWDELGGAMVFGSTPYPEVLEFMRAETAWARERGVAFTEADGLLGEAYALAGLGEIAAARERIVTVRALFEALPSTVEQLGEAWMLEAVILRDGGDLPASADALERAVAVFEACGEAGWARTARLWLVHALLDVDRTTDAAELLEQVRLRRSSLGWFQALVSAADARLAVAHGDRDRARALALAGSSSVGLDAPHRNAIRALELLGDLLAAIGDDPDARLQYEDARARARAKEDRVAEARLRSKLDATHRLDGRVGG